MAWGRGQYWSFGAASAPPPPQAETLLGGQVMGINIQHVVRQAMRREMLGGGGETHTQKEIQSQRQRNRDRERQKQRSKPQAKEQTDREAHAGRQTDTALFGDTDANGEILKVEALGDPEAAPFRGSVPHPNLRSVPPRPGPAASAPDGASLVHRCHSDAAH